MAIKGAWKALRLFMVLALALIVLATCGSGNRSSKTHATTSSATASIGPAPVRSTPEAVTPSPTQTPRPTLAAQPTTTPTPSSTPIPAPASALTPTAVHFPLPTPTAFSSSALVPHHELGDNLLLPENWTHQTNTGPTTVTDYWYDPANPLDKLNVFVSPAVGATENQQTGQLDVQGLVPSGASTDVISRWKAAYQTITSDDPYPDNGLAIITPEGAAHPNGYIRVDLWLPASDHGLASQMLNSFTPS